MTKQFSVQLPADLVAAIEGAHVVQRASDPEDGPRVIVQLEGRNAGWVHSLESSRDALLARWPELSDEQLARAMRFLDSTVRTHLAATNPPRRRSRWVHSWRD